MQVSIARALRMKNRLAGKIAKTSRLLQTKNSYQFGSKDVVDTNKLLSDTLEPQIKNLIAIKTAIAKANVGIYEVLTVIQEKKGFITLLSQMSTREGKETIHSGFNTPEKEIEYIAHISESSVREKIAKLEAEIEELEEEVNSFNSTTKIEVPDDL